MTAHPDSLLAALLQASRLCAPDDLADLVAEHARAGLGAEDAAVYVVGLEQRVLVPLPRRGGREREPVVIDGTLAGRCYRQIAVQETRTDGGGRRMWVPILDGLERVGVLELVFGAGGPAGDDEGVQAFAALVAELLLAKNKYGDALQMARRRRPVSLAAEIAWNLLPPLTFGTEQVVISAVLAPAYEVGGDSFDYGVDASTARVAVFDAMGHGLEAGLMATVAVAAYRSSRRQRLDLSGTVAAIDAAIAAQFGLERFVTAVLAELDLGTGRLRWTLAGHPAPLLLRRNRVVKALEIEAGLPLGLGVAGPIVEETLEPGDRLLFFSDGVVEARAGDGEFFGVDRLGDFVGREAAAAQPAPETMRRLMHAILAHQAGELQDDATTVMVEWAGAGAQSA